MVSRVSDAKPLPKGAFAWPGRSRRQGLPDPARGTAIDVRARAVPERARLLSVIAEGERGVSSFKMLPGRPEECVGLKSVECGARTTTYLFCFDLDGRVPSDDIFPGDYKCEGIEIL